MRISYQSFIDPERHSAYFERLRDHLAAIAPAGTEYVVGGVRPPEVALHRITEFRCAAQAIEHAISAEQRGFDAVLIGHFQDSGLYEARSAATLPVVGMGEGSMLCSLQLGRSLLSARERDFRVGEAVALNPIAVSCELAEAAASLRQASGLTTSRVSTFASPPRQATEELAPSPGRRSTGRPVVAFYQ